MLYGGSFLKDAGGICIGWIWYLQVEFWYYLIFPLNASLYNRRKIYGIIFTVLLGLAAWAQNFHTSYYFYNAPAQQVK